MTNVTIKQKSLIKEKYSHDHAIQLYQQFKKDEEKFDYKLEKGAYYIVRFDGKSMTKDYKIKKEPINELFFNTMKETFQVFCSTKEEILFAYSFSDEISILIKGPEDDTLDTARIEKILSLYASELSILFYKNASKNKLDLKRESIFDARLIKPESIANYFIARQAFAIDKYLMQLKGKYGINYKYSSSKKVLNALERLNKDYLEFPPEHCFGLVYSPKRKIESFEFQADPSKLENLL